MWPYPWTHVGTPSPLGHMDRVTATMPSEAHVGAAQEAPDIGQWEGQDVPLVRPSSCKVKRENPSSRRYLPTYLQPHLSFTIRSIILSVSQQHTYVIHTSFNRSSNHRHMFLQHEELNLMWPLTPPSGYQEKVLFIHPPPTVPNTGFFTS